MNEVSFLQQECQRRRLPPPEYIMVVKDGPSHSPFFLYKVSVLGHGEFFATELASTAKQAKREAAAIALQQLGWNAISGGSSGTGGSTTPVQQSGMTLEELANLHIQEPNAVTSTCISQLNQVCQAYHLPAPEYDLPERVGPAHRPAFRHKVFLQLTQELYQSDGWWSTAKAAKASAAKVALDAIVAKGINLTPLGKVPPTPIPSATTTLLAQPALPFPASNNESTYASVSASGIRAPYAPPNTGAPIASSSSSETSKTGQKVTNPVEKLERLAKKYHAVLKSKIRGVGSTSYSAGSDVWGHWTVQYSWDGKHFPISEPRSGEEEAKIEAATVALKILEDREITLDDDVDFNMDGASPKPPQNMPQTNLEFEQLLQTDPNQALLVLAQQHHATLTEHARSKNFEDLPGAMEDGEIAVGQRFICQYQWNDEMMPKSNVHLTTVDASKEAALLAVMALVVKNIQFTPPSSSDQRTAAGTASVETPTQNSALSGTSASQDCVSKLYQFQMKNTAWLKAPEFAEVSDPTGYKFRVLANGHVMSTSNGFKDKASARRHAAQIALEELIKISQNPVKLQEFTSYVPPGAATGGYIDNIEDVFDKIDREMKSLMQVLRPSSEMRKMSSMIISELGMHLKDVGFEINRIALGGSFGRNTSIVVESDVDLVILQDEGDVTPMKPTDLFELFKTVQRLEELRIDEPGNPDSSVSFAYEGLQTLDIRFLLGVNLIPPDVELEGKKHRQEELQKRILQRLDELVGSSESTRRWECSTVETLGVFMRAHESATPLCRLLKFWYSTLNLSQPISEHTLMLDLLAVYTFDQLLKECEGDQSRMPLFRQFEQALAYIMDWPNLQIVWSDNYDSTDHPFSPPYTLDPSLPQHNLIRAQRSSTSGQVASVTDIDSLEDALDFSRSRKKRDNDETSASEGPTADRKRTKVDHEETAWDEMADFAKQTVDTMRNWQAGLMSTNASVVETLFETRTRSRFQVLPTGRKISIMSAPQPFPHTIPTYHTIPGISGVTLSKAQTLTTQTTPSYSYTESQKIGLRLCRLITSHLAMLISTLPPASITDGVQPGVTAGDARTTHVKHLEKAAERLAGKAVAHVLSLMALEEKKTGTGGNDKKKKGKARVDMPMELVGMEDVLVPSEHSKSVEPMDVVLPSAEDAGPTPVVLKEEKAHCRILFPVRGLVAAVIEFDVHLAD